MRLLCICFNTQHNNTCFEASYATASVKILLPLDILCSNKKKESVINSGGLLAGKKLVFLFILTFAQMIGVQFDLPNELSIFPNILG